MGGIGIGNFRHHNYALPSGFGGFIQRRVPYGGSLWMLGIMCLWWEEVGPDLFYSVLLSISFIRLVIWLQVVLDIVLVMEPLLCFRRSLGLVVALLWLPSLGFLILLFILMLRWLRCGFWSQSAQDLSLHRNFNDLETIEWANLSYLLSSIHFWHSPNSQMWPLDPSMKYYVKLLVGDLVNLAFLLAKDLYMMIWKDHDPNFFRSLVLVLLIW